MADQVMRMPGPSSQGMDGAWPGRAQRDLLIGWHRPACACRGGCPGCRSAEPAAARGSSFAHNMAVSAATASRLAQLRGVGGFLDAATWAFMEPRFDHDFGAVRIHTGPEADRLAADLQARAFTLGNDIVFARGAYAPHSHAGRRLLAHELSHTIQQTRGSSSRPSAPAERVQRNDQPTRELPELAPLERPATTGPCVLETTAADIAGLAARSGTLTVIELSMDRCGPCKLLHKVLESLCGELGQGIAGWRYAFHEVNTSRETPEVQEELRTRYKFAGAPFTLLFAEGELVGTMSGFDGPDLVRSALLAAAEQASLTKKRREREQRRGGGGAGEQGIQRSPAPGLRPSEVLQRQPADTTEDGDTSALYPATVDRVTLIKDTAGAVSGFGSVQGAGNLNKPGPINSNPAEVLNVHQIHFFLDRGDPLMVEAARYVEPGAMVTHNGMKVSTRWEQLKLAKFPAEGFPDGPQEHEIVRADPNLYAVADAPGSWGLTRNDYPVKWDVTFAIHLRINPQHSLAGLPEAGSDQPTSSAEIAFIRYQLRIEKERMSQRKPTRNDVTKLEAKDLVRNRSL